MAALGEPLGREAGTRAGAGETEDAPSRPIGVGRAFREAITDFYFNSWRLAPANLAWAAVALLVLVAAGIWLPLSLLVAFTAVPLAGLHRMAAMIVRGHGTSLSDFATGMRDLAVPALTAGLSAAILAAVFAVNIGVGLALDGPIGWFLAASALYAEVALAMLALAFWPILADPDRAHLSLRRRLTLAGLVCLTRPGRILVVTLLLAAVLAGSVVLLAGIALVGVAYAGLVATRFVLPLADLVEARLPAECR